MIENNPQTETNHSSPSSNNNKSKNDKHEKKTPLATLSEVFSFSTTQKRTRTFLILGLTSATITGCVYPAMAFFFAKTFQEFSVDVSDGGNFMDGIREIAFTFMVLGVIVYFSMSIQNTLLDTAATEMTHVFQRTYFSLLLYQDPTYFDLTDVAGAAGMISQNGAKFKKGIGRKLGEGFQFGISMIGGFCYAFYASWKVSLAILTTIPPMAIGVTFYMNVIATQSSASSKGYQRAGEIAYAAVSGIRTVLSLNAVGITIDKYKGATKEARDSATKREWKVGLANGAIMGSMLLGYIVITLFGMWILYDAVMKTGCDPSNTVPTNEPCSTTGMDVFGSLMGISFAAMGLPQINAMMEALTGARAAAYPLFVLKRRCEGVYNDDFDIKVLLDETTAGGITATNDSYSDGGKAYRGDNENSSDDKNSKSMDVLETIQHKKCIPPSKMPPYLINASCPSGLQPESCTGTIDFCNVSFSYPSRRQAKVLNALSLQIESGTTVAIVGHSGCGKSSIIHLVERFYDIDKDDEDSDAERGTAKTGIQLDGVDLGNLNVHWLRSQIGLVSQEPKLFAKTIRENIALGVRGAFTSKEPTQEEIEEAAKLANAHEFISSFPNGYDTFVGDSGAQLSGGQKQRIAIARVLLRRPKILLLDEATSALDSESERTVQRALDNLLSKDSMSNLSKMTTIVVAHRLSTIKYADLIAVVDKGQIVEKGTHDELMAIEGGTYRALVRAQTLPPITESNANDSRNQISGIDNSKNQNISDEDGRVSVFIPSTDKSLSDAENEIVLKDVRFHYPTRKSKEIFRGLNLSVKRGENLALVGPSGQGKSTVMQLLERYYDPTHGSIEFEGRDLKNVNIGYYRDQIGLVSQEPTLFNDTIAANIKYGKPDATDDEMYEAAKLANAHNFITTFPDGYNTQLGETALAVSGGQKQRIAIARAIIKRPRILLLDEATSALDTGSEKVVQEALDRIMSSSSVTTIVIAHRLSTIQNADRIAYIGDGKVREIGSHNELMGNPDSKYRRLQEMQNMGIPYNFEEHQATGKKSDESKGEKHHRGHRHHHHDDGDKKKHHHRHHHDDQNKKNDVDANEKESDKGKEKKNVSKARLLARDDWGLLAVGSIGALLSGLMFPGWGVIFAYMIEFLYYPVLPCDVDAGIMPPPPHASCQEYREFVKEDMQDMSITLTFGWIAVIASTCIGSILIFYGFGTASENMSKRVRDAAFNSLLRQEISFFDVHTVGSLTAQLSDDAAMIHSFSGEPLRQLIMSISSVLVGVIVSFVYMWPFALVSLGTIPFMGFGAEMEMKMYMGEDLGDHTKEDEDGPGAIAIESLLNIRTVASLSLETVRLNDYNEALTKGDPDILKSNFKKGSLVAIGQFIQMWGTALMFWWGGWLLSKYPDTFSYRDFLISMFSLLFSLSGLGMAAQGATNREKAKAAAERVFDLIERESAIDPLGKEGYKEDY